MPSCRTSACRIGSDAAGRAGYRFSPAARRDLDGIWPCTVPTWGAAQAERYVLAIRDACQALAEGRRRGQAIDAIRPGYRKLAVGSHLLFHRVGQRGAVEIIRILHQRMDVAGRMGAEADD